MNHRYTVEVDDDGGVVYRKDGKWHRDGDLPAVILGDGTEMYWKEGKIHRDGDKPAVIDIDGSVEYWKKDKRYEP